MGAEPGWDNRKVNPAESPASFRFHFNAPFSRSHSAFCGVPAIAAFAPAGYREAYAVCPDPPIGSLAAPDVTYRDAHLSRSKHGRVAIDALSRERLKGSSHFLQNRDIDGGTYFTRYPSEVFVTRW